MKQGMKTRGLGLVIAIAVFVSSCAIHNGTMVNSASLSKNNFRIVGNVTGTAKTFYVLGMGGINKEALVLEAKKDMYNHHPLKSGQAYANISVDFARKFLVFTQANVCTINADVVQFLETDFNTLDTTNSIVFLDANNNIDSLKRYQMRYGFLVDEHVKYQEEKGLEVMVIIEELFDGGANVIREDNKGSFVKGRFYAPYNRLKK